jgi:hypothetical protein
MGEFVEGMGSVEADLAWAGNMDDDELLVVVTGFGVCQVLFYIDHMVSSTLS